MAATRSSSTSSNISTTLKRSTPKLQNSVAAQDLLALQDTVIKFGLLRKKGKRINFGKWPHKFVILTYDSVYIYANETSKLPNSKFGLAGYNQVARSEGKNQNWCFSIVPANIVDCTAVITFACVSDAERKDWMKTIRNQMYSANFIKKPERTEKSMSITDEDDYIYLEQQVYTGGTTTFNNDDFDNDDDDGSNSSSDSNKFGKLFGVKKSLSNAQIDDVNDSGSSSSEQLHTYESYDEQLTEQPSKMKSGGPKRRQPKDPQPRPPTSSPPEPKTSSAQPPRYSEVFSEDETGVYVNAPAIKQSLNKSLVALCTIVDKNPDRDKLIAMLQSKKESGTYLIRNSRNGDQKVLAYLTPSGHVKEYKILGTDDRLTLDQKQFFKSLEELLVYYTSETHLPMSPSFLKRGVHDDRTNS